MSGLDSPLEALAFNYVNFGLLAIVNNLWTWIAVVTAAVSFWRIRAITGGVGATSFSVKVDRRSFSVDQIGSKPANFGDSPNNGESQVTAATAATVEETVVIEAETETQTVVWGPLTCYDGVKKGKFTVYYVEDGDGERDSNGESSLTAVSDGEVDGSGEWWEKWERVVKMRNGDDGWYRCMDLTVINGNVVRLWEENGVHNGGSVNAQGKTWWLVD